MNTSSKSPLTPERLAALLAKVRAQKIPVTGQIPEVCDPHPVQEPNSTTELSISSGEFNHGIDRSTGLSINYHEKQLEFINTASSGKSAVLIGAAGSGKTTGMRGTLQGLISSGRAGILSSDGHKFLRSGTPGIVVVSFTRRAVSNIRKAISEDMKGNCLTIHSLLEYEPVYYEVYDKESGTVKKTMSFEPTRTKERPLSRSIRVCVVEESSMVSVELFKELQNALPEDCQFIFLGDIQQLPPVFGSAILGFKMLELPVVELTEIYRQALESPIIRLAHRILSGNPIPDKEYPEWKFQNQLTIHPWKKSISADSALATIAKFLTQAIDTNNYDPYADQVLIPFNKACGTDELNKHIAQHISRKKGNETFEIIAGFKKGYFAVGDRVLWEKEDAEIIGIKPNPAYTGAQTQPSGIFLDRWGYNSETGGDSKHHLDKDEEDLTEDEIEFMLAQSVASSGEDTVRQASHILTIKLNESGETDKPIELSNAGALNNLILSFALTVHKSQGSEFRKVFLMLHKSHATMLSREMLYTACTRAKEELYIICEPDSMTKGILSQRIKGNTLEEKIEYFKGKQI